MLTLKIKLIRCSVLCAAISVATASPACAQPSELPSPIADSDTLALAAPLPSAPEPNLPVRSGLVLPQHHHLLGFSPNLRIVNPGTQPAPPGARQAFLMATQNSFSASSLMTLGLTSMIAEGNGSHDDLGKGLHGYWEYSWRGFLDKTDGNFWTLFILPTLLREDERYYIKGQGSIRQRTAYAASRVLVARDYSGQPTLNGAEILGRAIAQGISSTYYPDADATPKALAIKFGFALGRDALTNTFREFMPGIKRYFKRRRP